MSKPVIIFFGSSIRTNCWMNLYNSLKGNKVPFEDTYDLLLVSQGPSGKWK